MILIESETMQIRIEDVDRLAIVRQKLDFMARALQGKDEGAAFLLREIETDIGQITDSAEKANKK